MSEPLQLTLDYSESSRAEMVAFLDRQIEAETNLLVRRDLIESRDLVKSDDGYFRHMVDHMRKTIRSGAWEKYKVPSRKN